MEFRDLKAQYNNYKKEIDNRIEQVMMNSDFIGGKEVEILEERLADYVGVKHCITCANGTDALTLVLQAWGIGKGDAVFIPDFTFFATGEVVSYEGATPIFVDVDNNTFNIDSSDLEKKILEVIHNTDLIPKVIIPVDLFGLPADYNAIEDIAKKYNILVLEDGAQGFGGKIGNKVACSFGDAATTSFFPAKPLGCYGDGGAIFTNDDNLNDLIRSLKFHGKSDHKYNNVRIGMNSRLDTIQAAILNVKLDAFINHEFEDVNKVYEKYNKGLKNIVKVPIIPENFLSSFAQYTITLNSEDERNNLQKYLKEFDIPTNIYYPKPMHKQSAFGNLEMPQNKNTIELCKTVLSLPMHPYLTDSDINFVISKVKDFYNI